MNVLIVDTSVWINFFRGDTYPDVELALKEARVILSPLVLAELLSGVRNHREKNQLIDFLSELKLADTSFEHWKKVGDLRNGLAKAGINVSIPDAHIAQCSLDADGYLMSHDKIFNKIATRTKLKLLKGDL